MTTTDPPADAELARDACEILSRLTLVNYHLADLGPNAGMHYVNLAGYLPGHLAEAWRRLAGEQP